MNQDLAFLAGHALCVYSSHGCPDCVRLDQWLARNGVPHTKVWIDEDSAAAEKLERETGKQAVPFLLVDGSRWVRGYHTDQRSRLNEDVLAAELAAAIDVR